MWNVLGILFSVYLLITLILGRFIHFSYRGLVTKPPTKDELKGYAVEDVELTAPEGNKLAAWFVKAPNNPENKAMIMVHGWNHTRDTILPHIRFFVDAGYHVFAFDQRSHGASSTARISFGPREAKDFKTAFEYMLSRSDVNPERIGALAESIGGSTVIHALAYYPEIKAKVKALLIEGTWANTTDIMIYVLQTRFHLPYLLAVIFAYVFIWPGTRIWGLGKMNHSYPVELIEQLHPIPLFFIRGQDDHMVPEYSAMNMMNRAKEPKTIWILPDSKHRKSLQTYPDEYKERVLAFYGQYV